MTGTAMLDALTRMATDPAFAEAVRSRPEMLVERYGLSAADAATIAATPIDTTRARPRRLEERLSRSGGVFGSALASAVDALHAPTEPGGDSSGSDSSGGSSGGDPGAGDARSDAGADHGDAGAGDNGGDGSRDDGRAEGQASGSADGHDGTGADGKHGGAESRGADGPAPARPESGGTENGSSAAPTGESADPSPRPGADHTTGTAPAAPPTAADGPDNTDNTDNTAGPAARPQPDGRDPDAAAQQAEPVPPTSSVTEAGGATAGGATTTSVAAQPAADGGTDTAPTPTPTPTATAPAHPASSEPVAPVVGPTPEEGSGHIQTEVHADGSRLVTISQGNASASFEVTSGADGSPQVSFGVGDGPRSVLANAQDQLPVMLAGTNLDPAAVNAALGLDPASPDSVGPLNGLSQVLDGPREITVTAADGSTHPVTITPQQGGGYVQTSVNADGTSDTYTVSADGVVAHTSSPVAAPPATDPADGYPPGNGTPMPGAAEPGSQWHVGTSTGAGQTSFYIGTGGDTEAVVFAPEGTVAQGSEQHADGTATFTFVRPDGSTQSAIVAPDGTTLAQEVPDESGRPHYYLNPTGGGAPVELGGDGSRVVGHTVNGDGSTGYTVVHPDGTAETVVVAFDGSTTSAPTDAPAEPPAADPTTVRTLDRPDGSRLVTVTENGQVGTFEVTSDLAAPAQVYLVGEDGSRFLLDYPPRELESFLQGTQFTTALGPAVGQQFTIESAADGSATVTVGEGATATVYHQDSSGALVKVGPDGQQTDVNFLPDGLSQVYQTYRQSTDLAGSLAGGDGAPFSLDGNPDGSRVLTVGEGAAAQTFQLDRTVDGGSVLTSAGADGGRVVVATAPPPGAGPQVWTFVDQPETDQPAAPAQVVSETGQQYSVVSNPDGSRDVAIYWPGDGQTVHSHITPNPDGTVTVSEDNAAGTGLTYTTDPATLFSDLSPAQRAAILPQHETGMPPVPGDQNAAATGVAASTAPLAPATGTGTTATASGIPLDQNAQLFTGQDGRSQVVVATAQGPVTVYLPADGSGAEKVFGTTSDGRVIPVYSEVQDGGRVLTVLGPDAPLQTTYVSSGLLPTSSGWTPPGEIQAQVPIAGQPAPVNVLVGTGPDGLPEFAFNEPVWGNQVIAGHALANPDGSWDVVGVHSATGEIRVHAVLAADGHWQISPADRPAPAEVAPVEHQP